MPRRHVVHLTVDISGTNGGALFAGTQVPSDQVKFHVPHNAKLKAVSTNLVNQMLADPPGEEFTFGLLFDYEGKYGLGGELSHLNSSGKGVKLFDEYSAHITSSQYNFGTWLNWSSVWYDLELDLVLLLSEPPRVVSGGIQSIGGQESWSIPTDNPEVINTLDIPQGGL